MVKSYVHFIGLAVGITAAMPVVALEAQPTGQIQIQAAYVSESVNSHDWLLQMPNNYVGVTAVETLPNGTFTAYLRAGFEPLADDLVLDQQQMYINWQQGIFSLWGGELPSLEATYIEQDAHMLASIERGGLAVASQIDEVENKAVRADFQSGDTLLFSGQWVMDEAQDDMVWSLAAVVQSPEGTFASTYRKIDSEAGQWGLKARWVSGTTTIVAATVFQEEVLAWDLGLQLQGQRSVTFVNYGVEGENDGLWRIGIHQYLTAALVNFSEVVWAEDKEFQWSTGFQLSF